MAENTPSMAMAENTPSIPISSDLFAQIVLPYLPATHLQALKTVSKDWLQLITSAYFVRRHLSIANQNRIRVLITFPSAILDYYETTTRQQIPYPLQFPSSNTKIVGSADGLICLLNQTMQHDGGSCLTAIFNPSTRKSFVLQLWPHRELVTVLIIFWWFGSTAAGEYVLVVGMLTPMTYLNFGVYKFGRTAMRRIHDVSINLHHSSLPIRPLEKRGTLVQGVVYWPVQHTVGNHQNPFTIFAYHLNNNTHSEIPPPVQFYFTLGVVDGCLLASLKNMRLGVFELWIMKKQKQSFWTKYANIDIGGLVLSPLGFFRNGHEMVLDVDNTRLIKYNINNNHPPMLLMEYECPRYEAIMSVDTLVSPAIWEED